MTNEIEKLTTDLAAQAAGLMVTNQTSANRATFLILAGKDAIKKIKGFFAPLKDSAKAAHQGLVDKEKAELAKVEPVVDALNGRLASWRAEEKRKWDAAEAERLRIEREKQRLEEEALRKVKEAEERAERERQRLEREAERLQKEAVKKADDEVAMKRIEEEREQLRLQAEENRKQADEATDNAIDEAAKAEAEMAPAPAVPEAPKTEGLSWRDNWEFEITDRAAIPREYLIVDEVKVGKVVRALKVPNPIPDGRAFNRPIPLSIGKRNGSSLN